MKKALPIIITVLVLAVIGFYALNNYIYKEKQGDGNMQTQQTNTTQENSEDIQEVETSSSKVKITPISHAAMILDFNGTIVYNDPTGGAALYTNKPEPDLILISDIHGDHFNADTLLAVSKSTTILIVPQAVKDILPKDLKGSVVVVKNGEKVTQQGLSIEAIPMYNIPETADSRHTKGRGNGYVIEANGERIYIAGDTSNTPEMQALKNIDIAFLPMNAPTMSIEEAALATVAFKPKKIIPYHYRIQDGYSDTNKFKQLVNAGDPNIQVDLINFYPTN